MKSSLTPPPWIVSSRGTIVGIAPKVGGGPPTIIATLLNNLPEHKAAAEANGRFITTAPDMFTALDHAAHFLIELATPYPDGNPIKTACLREAERIRTVMVKAMPQ